MTDYNLEILKIGTYLHDFLMNANYKKKDLNKAKKIMDDTDKRELKKTLLFINEYLKTDDSEINRRKILDEFEDISVELFQNTHQKKGTVKAEIPGKLKMPSLVIERFLVLGAWAAKLYSGEKKSNNKTHEVIEIYSLSPDDAISFPFKRFLVNGDEEYLKDICYEIFYVLSSGVLKRGVFNV